MRKTSDYGVVTALAIAGVCIGTGRVAAAPADAPGPAASVTDYSHGWVGKTASGFVLPGIDGKLVDVGTLLGKKPIVLIFYRGVW